MPTFAVSDVAIPSTPMAELVREEAVRSMLHSRIEQVMASDRRLVSCTDINGLAQAAHDAFYKHYPLVLTPDAVWFCLAQGFAQHVAQHAETLRRRFVQHEGKLKLVVERADFRLGQPNPWPEAFAAFSGAIAAHVGKLRDLVVADFTTTGAVERAASEVLLMDTFSPYFEYEMMAGCGIPSITLLGTAEDWRSIRRRAATLSEYGLDDWIRALLPVLEQIVDSSEGKVDPVFWRSFFRYQSGSGPAELTGWITVLFPYLMLHDRRDSDGNMVSRLGPNPHLSGWEQAFRRAEDRQARKQWLRFDDVQGPALDQIPASLATAPVRLIDGETGEKHALKFVAGMFGVVQDESTLTLAPEFGWAVVHEK